MAVCFPSLTPDQRHTLLCSLMDIKIYCTFKKECKNPKIYLQNAIDNIDSILYSKNISNKDMDRLDQALLDVLNPRDNFNTSIDELSSQIEKDMSLLQNQITNCKRLILLKSFKSRDYVEFLKKNIDSMNKEIIILNFKITIINRYI